MNNDVIVSIDHQQYFAKFIPEEIHRLVNTDTTDTIYPTTRIQKMNAMRARPNVIIPSALGATHTLFICYFYLSNDIAANLILDGSIEPHGNYIRSGSLVPAYRLTNDYLDARGVHNTLQYIARLKTTEMKKH